MGNNDSKRSVVVHGVSGLIPKSIFDFSVKTAAAATADANNTILLSAYKGKKAYLIVNVASK
jgi:hypothetical protein